MDKQKNTYWDPPVLVKDAKGNTLFQIGDGRVFKLMGEAIEASKLLKMAARSLPPNVIMAPSPPVQPQLSMTMPSTTTQPPSAMMRPPLAMMQPPLSMMGHSPLMPSPAATWPHAQLQMDGSAPRWLFPNGTACLVQPNPMQQYSSLSPQPPQYHPGTMVMSPHMVPGTPSRLLHVGASSSAPPPQELQNNRQEVLITWSLSGNQVLICGSWDNWVTMYHASPFEHGHQCRLYIQPGTYHYLFVVDGQEQCNPHLPSQVDQSGRIFNLLIVTDKVSEYDPDGAVTLPDFLKDPENAPVEKFKFTVGTTAAFGSIDPNTTMYPVSSTGCILLNSFCAHAVKNFRKGLCWGGEFQKEDMIIIDGVLCRIKKTPRYILSLVYLTLDLDQIINNLLSEFKKFPEIPPYISYLEKVLRNPPADLDTNPTSRESFFKKMVCNAALSTASARMMALINMDQFLDGLGMDETQRLNLVDPKFDPVLKDLEVPPGWVPPPDDPKLTNPNWVQISHMDSLFDTVYWNGKKNPPKGKERYTATCLNMTKHLRHFVVHAVLWTMKNGKQLLESYKELDLMISYYFKDILAVLLDCIREACEKPGCHPLLKALWELFCETSLLFEQK